MEPVILDLTGCRYFLELQERLRDALGLPEYFGRNWDALWDSLVYESPVELLEIRGEDCVAAELRPAIAQLNEILKDAKKRREALGWRFDYTIAG